MSAYRGYLIRSSRAGTWIERGGVFIGWAKDETDARRIIREELAANPAPQLGRIGYAILAIAEEGSSSSPWAVELLAFGDRDEADTALFKIKGNRRAPKILRETATVVTWNRKR